MKRRTKLFFLFGGAGLVVTAAACSMTGMPMSAEKAFDTLSLSDSGDSSHKPPFFHKMQAFIKELNLTDAQKTQFTALRSQVKHNFDHHKGERQKAMDSLKTAFLSDKIDKEALKMELQSFQPFQDDKLTKISQTVVEAYQILTPEQRLKVKEHLNTMESRMGKFVNNPLAGFFQNNEKPLKWLIEGVNLTAEQDSAIKEILQKSLPDRKTMFSKAVEVKNQVFQALEQGQPDAAQIKAILAKVKGEMEGFRDQRLDKLVAFHDLLTPEQRIQVAKNFETHREQMKALHQHHQGKGQHRNHHQRHFR